METLRNGVRLGRLGHGLLFVGPRGTGKTSMARIVAKAVNCLAPVDGEPCDACEPCVAIREGRALDVVEMDAASNNTVQDMRDLLPRVYTAAADLRRKVFIVDEVQRIKEGWDVLLKTLEEPPDDVLFIFCTTNPAPIRPAVVSRLQRFTFRPLTVAEIAGKLTRILAEDGQAADPDAVTLVAELAAGGMRDAESMLDQLLAAEGGTLTADQVRALLGLADAAAVDAFVDALAAGDALAGIAVIDGLASGGRDLVAFSDQVVARLRAAVVARLEGAGTGRPALDRLDPPALAAVARRVATLDANRVGAGGYRFQLELLLLQGVVVPAAGVGVMAPASAPTPAPRAATPAPRPAAAAPRPTPSTNPAAATSNAPAAAPVTSTGGEALDRLRGSWPVFVAFFADKPAVKAIIGECRPVEVQGQTVVLGFPEDRPFYRDKAEQRRQALEAGIEHVLGVRYGVRCVTTNLDALEAMPAEAGGVDLVETFREIFAGDLADAAEIS